MSGGKTYQVTQVDPLNPHTKGMVYQVSVVGGFTQIKEMPEASADNVGIIYQYTGETDSNFTHGFFYESQALGTTPETYGWVAINVQQGSATNSATTDLSNLTTTGKNIANWSSNVSNCIINIPQDIKVRLDNGTLTLQSGSKFYIPNGVVESENQYSTITTTADITGTRNTASTCLVFLYNNALVFMPISQCYSGDTAPSSEQYMFWYDTVNNKVKYTGDTGSTWTEGYSFPICVITADNGIKSIDQVFNGFGYIGSSVFILPGVSFLRMAGKNSDGTLKSALDTVNTVLIHNQTNNASVTYHINAYSGSSIVYGSISSIPTSGYICYDEENNISYSSLQTSNLADLGAVKFVNTRVVSFKPKQVVNLSSSDYIANMAMPSSDARNLTLPATNGTIIAPTNGYFVLNKIALNAGERVLLRNESNQMASELYAVASNEYLIVNLPCSKGDVITTVYSATGTTALFEFVYTNGSK